LPAVPGASCGKPKKGLRSNDKGANMHQEPLSVSCRVLQSHAEVSELLLKFVDG
jgi:hypothetical protein